jgi:branched-chain amino acid transport system ATP-binding protein
MDPLLEMKDVHTYSGSAYILKGVSLRVSAGETVALLGRNGEGKTATIKIIMSIGTLHRGNIFFRSENISRTPTYQVALKGIAVVPKGRHIFPALSVIEHLRVPVCRKGVKREDTIRDVFELFPELNAKKHEPARLLSGGQQQMLVIARALVSQPKLLLMDEPMEGLAPVIVHRVIESLRAVQGRGVAILIASANFETAMSLAQSAYFMQKGKIVHVGTREELLASPETWQQYLGVRG